MAGTALDAAPWIFFHDRFNLPIIQDLCAGDHSVILIILGGCIHAHIVRKGGNEDVAVQVTELTHPLPKRPARGLIDFLPELFRTRANFDQRCPISVLEAVLRELPLLRPPAHPRVGVAVSSKHRLDRNAARKRDVRFPLKDVLQAG